MKSRDNKDPITQSNELNRLAFTTQMRWRSICFAISIAVVAMVWIITYQSHPAAPQPFGAHTGEGWWGWFDQGQYLKITNQFIASDFFNPDKYYPPLYPALPAVINNFTGNSEAYMVVDLILSLIFFGGLILNFRKYLNPLISLISVGLMYGATSIAYEQWVIPWTTNLSSTLLILISLLLSAEYGNTHHCPTWSNWRTSTAFFLSGLMVWVRPFEIIPALILCLGLLVTQTRRTVSAQPNKRPSQTALRLLKIVVVPFITFSATIAMYAVYNLKTFGSWEPSYSKTINSMGFSPWDLGFKFTSLVADSRIYGIDNGHLSHALPLVIPLTVLSTVSLFLLAFPQKILVVAALINFISYLSFNDLVPTGLFTFNNIHYFTWSIAVFGVSAIACLKVLIQTSLREPKFRRQHLPVVMSIWTIATITLMNVKVQADPIQLTTSNTTISCPSERSNISPIRGKAAQFQLRSEQGSAEKTSQQTRLLELRLNTSSNPTQVHLAHQDQIELKLNGQALLYRKDWRLVNRKEKEQNQLSILLHQPIAAHPLDGSLTIGKNSNIQLSDVNFSQRHCTELKASNYAEN